MRRTHLAMMAACLRLFLLAGLVVRRYSPTLAVMMAGVAMVIPPLAVIAANAGRARAASRPAPQTARRRDEGPARRDR